MNVVLHPFWSGQQGNGYLAELANASEGIIKKTGTVKNQAKDPSGRVCPSTSNTEDNENEDK